VELPPGGPGRRLRQAGRRLKKLGITRAVAREDFEGWQALAPYGVGPVDPLPLCRAMAPALALALLEGTAVRRRSVAIRGERADPLVWRTAQALCPQVGTLLLDLDRGGEDLAALLRRRYGAVALRMDQGGPPMVSLEFAPRSAPAGRTLRLWGTPELSGLSLAPAEGELPPELDPLPLLELLWETGRIACAGVRVLDRRGENTYNTG